MIIKLSTEIAGVGVGEIVGRSVGMATNGFETTDSHGVDITVWTSSKDFLAMGYIVDQLDSLIDEWFPGEGSGLGPRGIIHPRPRGGLSVKLLLLYNYNYDFIVGFNN